MRPLKSLDALSKPSPAVGWAYWEKKSPTLMQPDCNRRLQWDPHHGATPQMSILGQSLITPEQWKHQDLLHQRLSSGFPSTSSLKSSTRQQVKPY